MNTKIIALIFFAIIASVALADDKAPALLFSKAAKLAEDAIASASLPADCFLRSISIIQLPDGSSCYRANYKPNIKRNVQSGTEVEPVKVEFILVTMDGKVSFESETVKPRNRIQLAK